MKKVIFFLFVNFFFLFAVVQAQSATDSVLKANDSTISLNLLQAPASPAFNLLGISPNSIERPTDLNAFRLSIQNATNSFSKIPSNYSVEFAPASIFNLKDQTLTKFNSTKFKDVFWQSFSVSFGMTHTNLNDEETDDSTSTTKLGLGIKFSIIRPRWNDPTQQYIDSIHYYLDKSNKIRESILSNNSESKKIDTLIQKVNMSPIPLQQKIDSINYLNKQKKSIDSLILVALKRDTINKSAIAKMDSICVINLKRLGSGLKIVRKGPFLDFATGMVLDFPDNRFDNSRIPKTGAWLTGGYDGGSQFSALGVVRYLFQPDKIFADDNGILKTEKISTLDAGARIIVGGGNKFSASLEALYRSVLNKNTIPSSWRIVFDASYDIGFNRALTLALGRNFDGTISKSGNLIAALNFIVGFGSSKKIK